jgi:hypothetical protein
MGAGPFSAYVRAFRPRSTVAAHDVWRKSSGFFGRPARSSSAWMHPAELEAHWRRARWLQGGATTHWRVR